MQKTDFLKLKYGQGKVIEPFLSRLFLEKNPKMVFWVSPWMTHMDFQIANTTKLLQKFKMQQVNLSVITRAPERGSMHEKFVMDVKTLPTASIFYMPILHAKFYIAFTKEKRYALLGSANMYEWSNRSYELGVVIESRGDGEVLIDKLENLAIDLRVTPQTTKA